MRFQSFNLYNSRIYTIYTYILLFFSLHFPHFTSVVFVFDDIRIGLFLPEQKDTSGKWRKLHSQITEFWSRFVLCQRILRKVHRNPFEAASKKKFWNFSVLIFSPYWHCSNNTHWSQHNLFTLVLQPKIRNFSKQT